MNLGKAFLAATVLAGLTFGGAVAGFDAVSDKIREHMIPADCAYNDLMAPYYASHADKDVSSLPVEQRIYRARIYAGENSELVKRYDAAMHKMEMLKFWHSACCYIGAGACYAYLFALAGIGAAALSRRTRTRDQRAGLTVACLSGIPAIVFAARHFDGPLITWLQAEDFILAPETYVCFGLLAVGAVVASGIPRKISAWITGGAKD